MLLARRAERHRRTRSTDDPDQRATAVAGLCVGRRWEAFSRLTRIFYGHVKTDPPLEPVFATMSPEHPDWVAQWLGEVFGGPATYTQERGGYARTCCLGIWVGR
jgi:hypothetical protein